MNVVEKWFFANLDADCFLPIVKNYKKIVIHLLEKRGSTSMYEKELGLALALLNILNRINETNSIISYEDFCIPEIADHIELPNAYIHWIISKTRGTSTNDFHICKYLERKKNQPHSVKVQKYNGKIGLQVFDVWC